MSEQVWQPPHVDGQRDIMRTAIEFCKLGESFDAYREIAGQIDRELEAPDTDYAQLRKLEELRASMADALVLDIVEICKWEDSP